MELKFKQSARYNFNYTDIRNKFVYSIVVFTHFNLSVGLSVYIISLCVVVSTVWVLLLLL